MKKKPRKIWKNVGIAALGFLLLAAALYCIPFRVSGIDPFIERKVDKTEVPGLAACIIKDGTVSWEGYYGCADMEKDIPVTVDTRFLISSTSKLVTATAALMLRDEGLLDLDEDINSYLPFRVRNPNHPDVPITPRMLLTHTSSYVDDWDLYDRLYTLETGGDSPVSLAEYYSRSLNPAGDWYNPELMFLGEAPGRIREYSNSGMALVGYLMECITGRSFADYTRERLFDPLGMDHTAWFLSEIKDSDIAVPYEYADGSYKEHQHYGYPTYPDGQIRTTIRDFARFFQLYINKGVWEGKRLISEETIEELLTIQFPEADEYQALGWYYNEIQEIPFIPNFPGHTGGDYGSTSVAMFDPDSASAVLMFSNYSPNIRRALPLYFSIPRKLLYEAGMW